MGWRAAARLGAPRVVSAPLSQQLGLVGAALFLLSDALIAFDKFYAAIPRAKIYVMLTCEAISVAIADAVCSQTMRRNC